MATFYISTLVTAVDTQATSKVLMLPPASNIQGTNLYIYDATGQASVNPITVSTPVNNSMDNNLNTIILNNNFQSLRLVPYSSSNYAITQNYTGGLSLFTAPAAASETFVAIGFVRNWAAFATDGTNILGVTGAGEAAPGFYTSADGGETWSYYPRGETFVDCCISKNGNGVMYAVSAATPFNSVGAIYVGDAVHGFTFAGNAPRGEFPYVAIDCEWDGNTAWAISQNSIYQGSGSGTSWTQITPFVTPAGTTFTDIATSAVVGTVYVSTANPGDGDGIYINSDGRGETWNVVNMTPTNPTQWLGVTTTYDGSIAYATEAGGGIYKSTDSGSNWSLLNADFGFIKPACDSTGTVLYGLPFDTASAQSIYSSTDGGATFTQFGEPKLWVLQYACDFITGVTFVGGVSGNYIYRGENTV